MIIWSKKHSALLILLNLRCLQKRKHRHQNCAAALFWHKKTSCYSGIVTTLTGGTPFLIPSQLLIGDEKTLKRMLSSLM